MGKSFFLSFSSTIERRAERTERTIGNCEVFLSFPIPTAFLSFSSTADAEGVEERKKKKEKGLGRGRLLVVGIGPGNHEHLTIRAREAIGEADVVVGYKTYIELVKELLAGKRVVRTGMGREVERARSAIELAESGMTVALISSGDAGIYGMAGPAFELLRSAGWDPERGIEVEVVPGVTALSACAAAVGAPVMHDFAAISLSDILTPWKVIAKRLDAAAAADFVVALYNPKSGRRATQLTEARRLMLKYRSPATPVAVVSSGKRRGERVILTTLERMLDHEAGMLTTIIVGNSQSFVHRGRMVTPRGYGAKYRV